MSALDLAAMSAEVGRLGVATEARPLPRLGLSWQARGERDHNSPPGQIDAGVRRCAVVFIVAKHELSPALIDRVPLAGVKHRLKFIEARGGGRPMTVAIPGKPASAAQPPAQSIQGRQRDQTDSQARDRHEEQHSHERLTQRAVSAFHRPPSEHEAVQGAPGQTGSSQPRLGR